MTKKSNNVNGYSKAYNCSQSQHKLFDTLKVRVFGSNESLFYSRDSMPKWLLIYYLDVTLKQPLVYKIKFKITLEQMKLVADSNKFLLKKSATETHCNTTVKHWTSKIYQI